MSSLVWRFKSVISYADTIRSNTSIITIIVIKREFYRSPRESYEITRALFKFKIKE